MSKASNAAEMGAVEMAQAEKILYLRRELDIQSQARIDATSRAAVAEAKVARVEALAADAEERTRKSNERFAACGVTEPKTGALLSLVGTVPVAQIRAALAGEQ